MYDHVQEVKEGGKYLQDEFTKLGLRWFGGNYTNGILIFLKNEDETGSLIDYLKKEKFIFVEPLSHHIIYVSV